MWKSLRWLKRQVPSMVMAAYLKLERGARWLGLNLPSSTTPSERAVALGDALPSIRDGADLITREYMLETYGQRPGTRSIDSVWRGIRWEIWREGVRKFFQSFLEDNRRKK